MHRLFKPLLFALGTIIGLGLLWPLAQGCVLGVIRGESCKWYPMLAFVDTYYSWIVLPLFVLIVITLLSRQSYRRKQASQSFDLLKPASELRPKDLGFRVVEREGHAEPEDDFAPNRPPFYESTYVPRRAVLYENREKDFVLIGSPSDDEPRTPYESVRHLLASLHEDREKENPEFYYKEDDLADTLRKGEGFVLIGSPSDGKTRSLFEVLRRMDDYEVVRLTANAIVPKKADLSLLFKQRRVILLLDDLSKSRYRELDLIELMDNLGECKVASWVVASTCRDGPELTRVQTDLGSLYDRIGLKLWLIRPTPQQKKELAEGIWEETWHPMKSDDYPTLGSIAMGKEAMKPMGRRFANLSGNHPEWADTLRALKLLDQAGVIPLHERLQAVLRSEGLFRHPHLRLHESLSALAYQGFLHPGHKKFVEPELGYLREDSVVSYVPATKPEDDFNRLADVLEELKDTQGLFDLSRTCSERFKAYGRTVDFLDRFLRLDPDSSAALHLKGDALMNLGQPAEALIAYEEALKIKSDDVGVLINKGNVLHRVGRLAEALEVFATALKIKSDDAMVLNNKGNVLLDLGRPAEALIAYEKALKIWPDDAIALNNKGNALRRLGRHLEALEAYEEALEIMPEDGRFLYNKGKTLSELGRYAEALKAFEEAQKIRPGDINIRYSKGETLNKLGRPVEALKAFEEALEIEPGDAIALKYRAVDLSNKGIMLGRLGRHSEALKAFEEALEMEPDDAIALEYKSHMLRRLERRAETEDL